MHLKDLDNNLNIEMKIFFYLLMLFFFTSCSLKKDNKPACVFDSCGGENYQPKQGEQISFIYIPLRGSAEMNLVEGEEAYCYGKRRQQDTETYPKESFVFLLESYDKNNEIISKQKISKYRKFASIETPYDQHISVLKFFLIDANTEKKIKELSSMNVLSTEQIKSQRIFYSHCYQDEGFFTFSF